tara:strand:- start:1394 stop:1759 length:366 start_codon:yes stop_codon:yes gene_type:complete
MTSTLTAIDQELLEEIIVEVCDAPIEDSIADYDKKYILSATAFCKELEDIGITTVEDWQDRMYSVANSDVDFLQEYLEDIGELQDISPYLVIDWQESWDRNYRFDFNVIEFEGVRWYFHNS